GVSKISRVADVTFFLAEDSQYGEEWWQLPGVGKLRGTVFQDDNVDGKRAIGEPGVSGCRIFLDNNGDGVWDNGEPSAITDAKGDYVLADVVVGKYILREAVLPGSRATTTYHLKVFVPPGGTVVQNFGVRFVK